MELHIQILLCFKLFCIVIAVEYQHIGCFSHSSLRETLGKTYRIDPLLTHKRCLTRCSRDSFLYFILKDGNICICDQDVSEFTKYKRSEECNSVCVGDSQSICGGERAIDVFRVNYCDYLQSPLNGYVNQTTSEAVFWCSDGYHLKGLKIIHCNLSTSEWDGPNDPQCVENLQSSVSSAASTFQVTKKPATQWSLEEKLLEFISSWAHVTILALGSGMIVLLVSCVVITSKYVMLKKSKKYDLKRGRIKSYRSDNGVVLTTIPHNLNRSIRRSNEDLREESSTYDIPQGIDTGDQSIYYMPEHYIDMTKNFHQETDYLCYAVSGNDPQNMYSRVLT